MINHTRADELEQAVLRLHLDLETLAQKVEKLSAHVEPPEPQPDLLVTIKSLHESNDGLRNQLQAAKLTEQDLDAEVVRLTKENQRLARLAWQAEQEKRVAEDALKSLRLDLLSCEADAERAREQRDNLALRLADAQRQREAMAQSALEQRRGLLSILGVEETP
jgi:chromosome segregation ATPase